MKYIMLTILGIALFLCQGYGVSIVRGPFGLPVSQDQRIGYLERYRGNALWFTLWLNQSFRDRDIEPGAVYGVWLEDMRADAEFQLVGNLFGPASIFELGQCKGPGDTWLMLRKYNCRYIAWDGSRAGRIAPYADVSRALDVRSPEWAGLFEAVELPKSLADAGCAVWKVRVSDQMGAPNP